MPFRSQAQRRFMYAKHPDIAKRWSSEFPNQKNLPERKKKKKARVVVNNKLKKGIQGQMDPDTNKVEINVRHHKHKDKRELASTIKHELLHVKHPKMTEKEVYKKSAKTKISPQEQAKLLSKLRNKRINYKVGSMKRKFKMSGDAKPGDLFNKYNESKTINRGSNKQSISKKRLSIMGLV